MTKFSIDYAACPDFDLDLLQLKQTPSYSEYTQGLQENTNVESSLQILFPESICRTTFCYDNASAQVLGCTACSTRRHYIQESDNIEMGEHKPIRAPNAEQLKSLPDSSLQLIDPFSNPDIKPNFTDFELFDHQSDDYENYHDIWFSSSISDGNSEVDIENCRSLDEFNTPSSSEVSLSRSFSFPPPSSPTGSWSMRNPSTVSLPTIYRGDCIEALNSNGLLGVGQWTYETMIELDDPAMDVESELPLSPSVDNKIVYGLNSSIVEAISSFELSFYDA